MENIGKQMTLIELMNAYKYKCVYEQSGISNQRKRQRSKISAHQPNQCHPCSNPLIMRQHEIIGIQYAPLQNQQTIDVLTYLTTPRNLQLLIFNY